MSSGKLELTWHKSSNRWKKMVDALLRLPRSSARIRIASLLSQDHIGGPITVISHLPHIILNHALRR